MGGRGESGEETTTRGGEARDVPRRAAMWRGEGTLAAGQREERGTGTCERTMRVGELRPVARPSRKSGVRNKGRQRKKKRLRAWLVDRWKQWGVGGAE